MENLDIFILNLSVNQVTYTTSLKSLSDPFINLKHFSAICLK